MGFFKKKKNILPPAEDHIEANLANSTVYVRDLQKIYPSAKGDVQAMKDVNINVMENEFVSIVGPSGCGKSTLLRMIGGLDTATSGKIVIQDRDIIGPGADRGMVFQSYTLFPWMTVGDNIKFGLKLRKMPADQQVSFDQTHVISTKELDIDGRQAIVIERQVLESARRQIQYELYVTYENNYLLGMFVYDDTELDTAIDIVKGLKLTATDDPEAKRRIVAEEYTGQEEATAAAPVYEADENAGKKNRFTETSKESMEEHMHQVGDSFNVPQSSLTAKVSKVELLDSPDAIDAAYALDPVKTDAEGKLLNNVIAYEKCGNGIDQLDEVVETKEVKEKILYIEVAYTNTSDQQTGDTMFQCGLLWAKETGDGYETVDVYAKDDVDYDSYYGQNYRISNVPLYYYNGKSAEEKNHLIRVQPGETRTVTLAFLVTEDELPYLYLDLFSGNADYTQFSQSALLYGYVDIRQ